MSDDRVFRSRINRGTHKGHVGMDCVRAHAASPDAVIIEMCDAGESERHAKGLIRKTNTFAYMMYMGTDVQMETRMTAPTAGRFDKFARNFLQQ